MTVECHSSQETVLFPKPRSEHSPPDYVYADVSAVDDGYMGAQIFIGTKYEVCDVQRLKSPSQFVNALEDNIRKHGAMDKLISDRAQTEIGKWALDILHALFISSWQSEPHQQQQNPSEHKYQTLKQYTNTILNHTGAPPPPPPLASMLGVCLLSTELACLSVTWMAYSTRGTQWNDTGHQSTPLFFILGLSVL